MCGLLCVLLLCCDGTVCVYVRCAWFHGCGRRRRWFAVLLIGVICYGWGLLLMMLQVPRWWWVSPLSCSCCVGCCCLALIAVVGVIVAVCLFGCVVDCVLCVVVCVCSPA